jgi:hypothetical protein
MQGYIGLHRVLRRTWALSEARRAFDHHGAVATVAGTEPVHEQLGGTGECEEAICSERIHQLEGKFNSYSFVYSYF